MRRSAIAGTIAALALAGAAAATPPVSPIDNATWTKSSPAFNTKFACTPFCQSWIVMMGTVGIRGPESAPGSRPKVGERFYVRTELALLSGPFSPTDTYKTRVLLPDGVTPSISAADDVICAVTDTSNVVIRIPGPAECQDPVRVGVQWEFPAVSLSATSNGQMAQFWFPVVASRPFAGEVAIQMTGTAVLNPLTLLPNPIVAEVPLFVDAAASNAPTDPASPGAPAGAPGGTGSATTPLTGVVAKPGGTGLNISWPAATAPGVTAYRVQARLVRTTRWINVGTSPSATTTLRWRKAKRGKRYQVRVAAIIGGVVGAWSKPVTVTAR